MNKRGDMSVVLLVFLVVLVCGIALFSFNLSKNGSTGNILDSQFIEGVYGQESALNFYLNELVMSTYLKAYSNFFLDGGDFYGGNIFIPISGERFYSFGSMKSEEVLNEDFKALLRRNLNSLTFTENDKKIPYIKQIQQKFASSDFGLSGSLNEIQFNLSGITLEENFNKDNLKIVYSSDVSLNYKLEDFDLVSFRDLESYSASCSGRSVDEKIDCLKSGSSMFSGFNLEIFKGNDLTGKETENVLVRMTSKRQFFFAGVSQNIVIRFLAI